MVCHLIPDNIVGIGLHDTTHYNTMQSHTIIIEPPNSIKCFSYPMSYYNLVCMIVIIPCMTKFPHTNECFGGPPKEAILGTKSMVVLVIPHVFLDVWLLLYHVWQSSPIQMSASVAPLRKPYSALRVWWCLSYPMSYFVIVNTMYDEALTTQL